MKSRTAWATPLDGKILESDWCFGRGSHYVWLTNVVVCGRILVAAIVLVVSGSTHRHYIVMMAGAYRHYVCTITA